MTDVSTRSPRLEESYRQYAGEMMMYATFLVGPAQAKRVFEDAWCRLRALGSETVELNRGVLYRQVYAAAGEGWREDRVTHGGPDGEPGARSLRGPIDQLSLDQRAMVYLADGLGLRTALVASQLGLPVPVIERSLGEARQVLDTNGGDGRALIKTAVAAAPAVPAYHEVPCPEQGRGGRLRSARLIWAVTGLAAILLLAPALFAGRGAGVTVTTTQITVPPGAVAFDGAIYLAQEAPDEAFSLVAFQVSAVDQAGILEEGDDPVEFLTKMTDLNVELPGAADSEGNPTISFFSLVPSGARVVERSTVTFQGREVIVLDMHGDFLDGSGTPEGDLAMLMQIVYTATADDPTRQVWFTVGGEPVNQFGSAGIDISTPIGRETFRDDMSPIVIEEPVVVEVETQLIRVIGSAKTTTGELTYSIDPADGEAVITETVDTGCAGCWGTFSFTVGASAMVPDGSISLYEAGADGQRLHEVKLPMTAGFDGRWVLSQ